MLPERSNQSGRYIVDQLFGAHNYAFICSPYISREYTLKIVQLARKGTLVKVLTSDKVTERDFYIREYFAEAKRKEGVTTLKTLVMKHRGQSFEHSKMYIVDDRFAVAGSANLTRPGMWQNSETVYISETLEDVQSTKEVFESAWKDALASAFGSENSNKSNMYSYYHSNRRSDYRVQQGTYRASKDSIFDIIIREISTWTK